MIKINKPSICLLIATFSCLFVFSANAINDSIIQKLVAEGSRKLEALQKSNEEKIKENKLNELNFIVNISSATSNYLVDYQIVGTEEFITNSTKEQELNQRLQQVYATQQKECYLILISCFDVEVKGIAPDSLTIEDVFKTGKFYNENSDIQDLKAFHESITAQIINSSTVDKSRQSYALSIGRYRGAFHKAQVGSYFYWFAKRIEPTNTTAPAYFTETYDYLRTYLANSPKFKSNPDGREYLAEEAVNGIESAVKNAPLKAQLLTTFTSSGIHNILQNFGNLGDYTALSVKERIHILSVLVNESMFGDWWFANDEEGYALKVLQSAPASSAENLLDSLAKPSILNNNAAFTGSKNNTDALIKRLIDHTNDGVLEKNYTALIQAINRLVTKGSNYNYRVQEMLRDENIVERNIFFNDDGSRYPPVGTIDYSFSQDANGNIKVEYSSIYEYNLVDGLNISEYTQPATYSLSPFALVCVSSNTKLSFIDESIYQVGAPAFFPAVFLKYLDDKKFNEDAIKVASITADVVTIVSGVGTLAEGVSLARRAWVAFEITNAIGNVTLNLADDVPPAFQDAVNYSNVLMLAVGGKNVLNGGYTTAKAAYSVVKQNIGKLSKQNLIDFAAKVKPMLDAAKNGTTTFKTASLDAIKKFYASLDKECKRIYNKYLDELSVSSVATSVESLENAFINGWTKEKILALPKGGRPLPTDYLKAEYISSHLTKFDGGAIRFTSRNSFNKYGTLGPDGGFVLPKSEFDNVLNETGGNLRQVEQKLGLDNGYLSDGDVMIVQIDKNNFDGLKIPSGNEGGANSFWIPGGYTSGGVPEAVLNFSSKPPFTEIKLK